MSNKLDKATKLFEAVQPQINLHKVYGAAIYQVGPKPLLPSHLRTKLSSQLMDVQKRLPISIPAVTGIYHAESQPKAALTQQGPPYNQTYVLRLHKPAVSQPGAAHLSSPVIHGVSKYSQCCLFSVFDVLSLNH